MPTFRTTVLFRKEEVGEQRARNAAVAEQYAIDSARRRYGTDIEILVSSAISVAPPPGEVAVEMSSSAVDRSLQHATVEIEGVQHDPNCDAIPSISDMIEKSYKPCNCGAAKRASPIQRID